MTPMEVTGVYTSSKSPYPQVVLKEKDGDAYLPIVIGRFEAAAISMAQNRQRPVRPISYDLACSLLEQIDAHLEKVEITDLHEGTYYAEAYLRADDGTLTVLDSRPSDAIALALRTGAPIYAARAVLKEAGYVHPQERKREASSLPAEPRLRGTQARVSPEEESVDRLELLRRRLRQAVAEEIYEEAARLRDEISRLEEESDS